MARVKCDETDLLIARISSSARDYQHLWMKLLVWATKERKHDVVARMRELVETETKE